MLELCVDTMVGRLIVLLDGQAQFDLHNRNFRRKHSSKLIFMVSVKTDQAQIRSIQPGVEDLKERIQDAKFAEL